jgi:hypothetical protein
MSDTCPYFIFAFADPVGDLKFIAKEVEEIEELLQYGQDNDLLRSRKIPKATGALIIDGFEKSRKHEPCFFHFSGHASHIGLHLQDCKTQSALALSAILCNNVIKVLFLNACSSAQLVKDILAQTSVEAIIATRTAVYDELAAEVSVSFYEHFVAQKKSLQEVYDYLYGQYELSCVEKRGKDAYKKRVAEMDEEFEKLDKTDKFAWGLFAKNAEILNASVSDIRVRSQASWLDNEAKIKSLEDELVIEEKRMKRDEDDPVLYKDSKKKVEALREKLGDAKGLRSTIIQTKIARKDNLILEEDMSAFEAALKALNYTEQRGVFNMNGKPIGGLVIAGDHDSVLDLLYRHLLYENRISDSSLLTFRFDPSSSFYEEFWTALVMWLKPKNIDAANIGEKEKKDILKHLIWDTFCGGGGIAHQDIIFKIICSNKDLGQLELTLDEFWRLWDICIAELKLIPLIPKWRYKVLFFLLDEMEIVSQERMKTFQKTIDQLKQKGRFNDCLQVLTPVDKMTEADIKKWLESQPQLNRLGLNAGLSKEIYQQSNGTIRQILKILKSKVGFEVPIITRLDIR